ncbi:hypothetical protein [Burkholderia gladioli]|uniref:hypothetical protein n=1 Tax=Burkholderia gladioli TaxID=28095 RepID=UPI0016428A16|nr:hypothetical protein [Burkholderia gladioli]
MMVRQRQQGFGALGLRALAPGLGLAALARSLGEPGKGGATWQIVDVDWPRYAEQVAVAKHLRPFAALSTAAAPTVAAASAGPVPSDAASVPPRISARPRPRCPCCASWWPS